jgi:type II secretory pathway component PulF
VRSLATARIARVLGVLMEGKVSLLDALALTRQATPNALYAQLVANAEAAVTRGEPVSSAFSDATLISSSVCEALRAGERTGPVGPVLLTLADFMDEDNEVVVKSITSILEPMILVILGAIVAFVAISMFMPLFDLAGSGMGGAGTGGAQ